MWYFTCINNYFTQKMSICSVLILKTHLKYFKVEALGYSSCILMGHDWGGIISWYYKCLKLITAFVVLFFFYLYVM